ncbi:unnamed protein product, partial [Amoebophrya sp. A25]|eukprot:GSA25T00009319001.1
MCRMRTFQRRNNIFGFNVVVGPCSFGSAGGGPWCIGGPLGGRSSLAATRAKVLLHSIFLDPPVVLACTKVSRRTMYEETLAAKLHGRKLRALVLHPVFVSESRPPGARLQPPEDQGRGEQGFEEENGRVKEISNPKEILQDPHTL